MYVIDLRDYDGQFYNITNGIFDIIIKDDKFFIPKGTDMIEPQVILVIAGTKKDINKFDNFLNK